MKIVLIQKELQPKQYAQLLLEFPHFELLVDHDPSFPSIREDQREQIEVLYGSHLDQAGLARFPELHWIHTPTAYLDHLCLDQIRARETLVISTTREENLQQIGEFASALLLYAAKEIDKWRAFSQNPEKEEAALQSAIESMRSPSRSTLLIIGLGILGTEIAKRAKELGFRIWGAEEEPSFHPHCEKTFHFQMIHALLPRADAVCLALPRSQRFSSFFGKKEFALMRGDSQLLAFGSGSALHVEELKAAAKEGKFRSVWIDAHFSKPEPALEELKKLPQVAVTPEIACYPLEGKEQGFHTFLYNLRQFQQGNFKDMKNLVELEPFFQGI